MTLAPLARRPPKSFVEPDPTLLWSNRASYSNEKRESGTQRSLSGQRLHPSRIVSLQRASGRFAKDGLVSPPHRRRCPMTVSPSFLRTYRGRRARVAVVMTTPANWYRIRWVGSTCATGMARNGPNTFTLTARKQRIRCRPLRRNPRRFPPWPQPRQPWSRLGRARRSSCRGVRRSGTDAMPLSRQASPQRTGMRALSPLCLRRSPRQKLYRGKAFEDKRWEVLTPNS